MKQRNSPKINNFVAKHAQHCGAGGHVPKQGKHVPRCKGKRVWSQEVDSCLQAAYNQ